MIRKELDNILSEKDVKLKAYQGDQYYAIHFLCRKGKQCFEKIRSDGVFLHPLRLLSSSGYK